MPYTIHKQGEKWVKINKDTGKVVSHHDTKGDAEASVKAYYANKLKEIIRECVKEVMVEINGTPEYSHENYGMLESDRLDSELMKYDVSYKLFRHGKVIRDRQHVQIFGPDFSNDDVKLKKYLEDKAYSMEVERELAAKGKNSELKIAPISGKNPVTDPKDLKIVGLIVNSSTQTNYPKSKLPAFDDETIKYLSKPLPPGSYVD